MRARNQGHKKKMKKKGTKSGKQKKPYYPTAKGYLLGATPGNVPPPGAGDFHLVVFTCQIRTPLGRAQFGKKGKRVGPQWKRMRSITPRVCPTCLGAPGHHCIGSQVQ